MKYSIDIKVYHDPGATTLGATLIGAEIQLSDGRRAVQQLAISGQDGLVPGLLAEAIGLTVTRLIRSLPQEE